MKKFTAEKVRLDANIQSHAKDAELDADIQSRVKWLTSLLNGDDSNIPKIIDAYTYIPVKTANYCYWSDRRHNLPEEDVRQQTMVEFLTLLQRIKGASERFPRLASINECGCCIGFKPWAIKSLRGRIKDWMTASNIIKVPKFNFVDANYLPPIVISMTVASADGTFQREEGLGTYLDPSSFAMEQEMWGMLNLTYREKQIISMRSQDYTLREIGEVIGLHFTRVRQILKDIQHHYTRIFHEHHD